MTVRHWRIVVLLIAAVVWSIDLWRPFDGRTRDSWREADDAAVARNYYREGMNPLYPRIDWRGTGPGFAEMELPILSWTMAAAYQVTGVRPVIGRVVIYIVSLAGLAAFLMLAGYLLPPAAAAAAGLFVALNPLVARTASSLQPEAIMWACLMAAVLGFVGWLETGSRRDYALAVVATALAILAKAPAAHIGLLFIVLLLRKRGVSAFADPWVWLFGVATLAPGALWYWHAHQLWLTWGNSLGVSNQAHWIGPDVLTTPSFFLNLAKIELRDVWAWVGLPVALYGVIANRESPAVRLGLWWTVVTLVYYVLTIRTTSAEWAAYYHVVSVAPAALLVGAGLDALARSRLVVAAIGAVAIAAFEARHIVADLHPHAYNALYADAQAFAPLVPHDALIVASGGECADERGLPVAPNASYMFYWMDRKGFNICRDHQSIASLDSIAGLGARYFVAEKQALRWAPRDLEDSLRRRYVVVSEGRGAILFRLADQPPSTRTTSDMTTALFHAQMTANATSTARPARRNRPGHHRAPASRTSIATSQCCE
jgi:dolichyl-phosphate-mannose-protein mannosyltransferase